MTRFFNGKQFARQKEAELIKKIKELGNKEIKPKLVSILIGDDNYSKLYLRLKKETAQRVGIKLEVRPLIKPDLSDAVRLVSQLNDDRKVSGIMVQLPLPKNFSSHDRELIINSIAPDKDVDGMRADSSFQAPVVRAVLLAFDRALKIIVRPPLKTASLKVVVVGHMGFEGRKIYKALLDRDLKWDFPNFSVIGVDKETKDIKTKTKDADVIISATGIPNLIKAGTVKQGVALIDVGSPKGDIEKSAYKKASFVSPVPGGIGPLTIYYLLDNLVESALKH